MYMGTNSNGVIIIKAGKPKEGKPKEANSKASNSAKRFDNKSMQLTRSVENDSYGLKWELYEEDCTNFYIYFYDNQNGAGLKLHGIFEVSVPGSSEQLRKALDHVFNKVVENKLSITAWKNEALGDEDQAHDYITETDLRYMGTNSNGVIMLKASK